MVGVVSQGTALKGPEIRKVENSWDGEMAQWSGALAALGAAWVPLPAPTWGFTATCNSSPRGSIRSHDL